MKFEEKDCNIDIICERVWDNAYADLSYDEYPESDKDWFELFKDYSDAQDVEISEKEMLDNRDTIIQYGKEYIEKEDSDNYDKAVNMMFECIANFEFEDAYICNPKLREKVYRDAAEKIYDKYVLKIE